MASVLAVSAQEWSVPSWEWVRFWFLHSGSSCNESFQRWCRWHFYGRFPASRGPGPGRSPVSQLRSGSRYNRSGLEQRKWRPSVRRQSKYGWCPAGEWFLSWFHHSGSSYSESYREQGRWRVYGRLRPRRDPERRVVQTFRQNRQNRYNQPFRQRCRWQGVGWSLSRCGPRPAGECFPPWFHHSGNSYNRWFLR